MIVAGSFELAGRLLLKLSADFAFQNFFSKSSVEALIFLNNLNLSNINAHEKIELAIKRIITNFTTKSARKKSFLKKNLSFLLNQRLGLLFLVPLKLITFRMCHEFGAFKVKYMINLFNYLHLI